MHDSPTSGIYYPLFGILLICGYPYFTSKPLFDFDYGDETRKQALRFIPSASRDNSTNALMSLDFPKRSDRKILERIIPPPSGGRDKLHFVRFTTALRAWYNSSSKLQFTLFLKLGSHYQRVSLKLTNSDAPVVTPMVSFRVFRLFAFVIGVSQRI